MPRQQVYFPLRDMRVALAAARAQGVGFDAAWAQAWRQAGWPPDSTDRAKWQEAARATRDEWRKAYCGEPSPVAAVIGTLLAHVADGGDLRAAA